MHVTAPYSRMLFATIVPGYPGTRVPRLSQTLGVESWRDSNSPLLHLFVQLGNPSEAPSTLYAPLPGSATGGCWVPGYPGTGYPGKGGTASGSSISTRVPGYLGHASARQPSQRPGLAQYWLVGRSRKFKILPPRC
eukprot:3438473-Rhodomonas_salina.1